MISDSAKLKTALARIKVLETNDAGMRLQIKKQKVMIRKLKTQLEEERARDGAR